MLESNSFNAHAALARLGGDEKLFKDLIGFFQDDAPGMLARITEAVAAGDAEKLARAAHSLKGLVASFDATATVASAQRLETMGIQRGLADAERELSTLRETLRLLQQDLDAYRDAHA